MKYIKSFKEKLNITLDSSTLKSWKDESDPIDSIFFEPSISHFDSPIEQEFCQKYNITEDDLKNRTYSVDGSDPVKLIYFINVNTDAVMAYDILDLENHIPLKEIIELKVGETYGMGVDVTRIS